MSEIIADPGVDKPVHYRLTGLLESTVYTFKVVSTNQYKGYNQAESSLISFTTLGKSIITYTIIIIFFKLPLFVIA